MAPSWVRCIVSAEDPLELEEAERLGMKTTVLLAKARESVSENRQRSSEQHSDDPELDIGTGWRDIIDRHRLFGCSR